MCRIYTIFLVVSLNLDHVTCDSQCISFHDYRHISLTAAIQSVNVTGNFCLNF